MRKSKTLPPEYFEDKYRADIDPWKFRTSEYEREKYAATLRGFGRERYRSGLEVGCSIGELTQLLSSRCASLLAIDASQTAIEAAAQTVIDGAVSFRVAALPEGFPLGSFDLIVLSEVLYYFNEADLERVALSCLKSASDDCEIVLCHWLGETDYPLTGLVASELFARMISPKMKIRSILHDEVYRLETFSAV